MQALHSRASRTVAPAGLLLLVLGLLAVTVTRAEEGRIPIFEPIVLDAANGPISGSYVVTRDIMGTTNAPVIQVIGSGAAADEHIEIDLNGFTLTSPLVTGVEIGIVDVSDIGSVAVRNGTAGAASIFLKDVTGGTVAWNRALGSQLGIRINQKNGNGVTVIHNQVLDSSSTYGIKLQNADGSLVLNNVVKDGGGYGIWLTGTDGSTIEGNTANGNADHGIYVDDSHGNILQLNNSSSNAVHGIRVHGDDNLVRNNSTTRNQGTGIVFTGNAERNAYGDNSSRNNDGVNGGTCINPAPGSCNAPQLCDDEAGNKSFGTNLMPGAC